MEPCTQRPPNGAVYGEVCIGRGSRHRQHRHAGGFPPHTQHTGETGADRRTLVRRNFAQFWCGVLDLLPPSSDAGHRQEADTEEQYWDQISTNVEKD